jgi:hypothetical protein
MEVAVVCSCVLDDYAGCFWHFGIWDGTLNLRIPVQDRGFNSM